MSRPQTLMIVLQFFLYISAPSQAAISFDWLVEGPRQAAGVTKLGGGYVLAENVSPSMTNEMYVRKISVNGHTEWDYRVGSGGTVTGIAADEDGNIYVVGNIGSADPEGSQVDLAGIGDQFLGTADAFVISLTQRGVRRFVRLYGTTGDENFHSIVVSGRQVFFGGWVQAAHLGYRDDVPLPGGSTVPPQEQTGVIVRMSEQGRILGETVLTTERQDGSIYSFPNGIHQFNALPDGGVLANGSVAIFRLRRDGSIVWLKESPYAALASVATSGERAWVLYFDDPDLSGDGASLARLNLDTGELDMLGNRGAQSTGTLWSLPGGRLAILGRKVSAEEHLPALRILDGEGARIAELVMSTASYGSEFHGGLLDRDTSRIVASIWFAGTWGLGRFPAYRPYLASALTDDDGNGRGRSSPRVRIKAGSQFSLQWKVVSVLGAGVGFRPELRDALASVSLCSEGRLGVGFHLRQATPSYVGNGVWSLKLQSSSAWRGSCRRFSIALPDRNYLSYEVSFF